VNTLQLKGIFPKKSIPSFWPKMIVAEYIMQKEKIFFGITQTLVKKN